MNLPPELTIRFQKKLPSGANAMADCPADKLASGSYPRPLYVASNAQFARTMACLSRSADEGR